MRMFWKAALAASLAAPLAAASAAPAAAGPLDGCPRGEPVCLYLSGSFPVTNPVVIPGRTISPTYLQGPQVCDSSGTDCITLWIGVPGATVDGNPNTIGTLTVPGMGIGVSSTGAVTLYATTPPTYTPSGTPVGITAIVTVQDFLVVVSGTGMEVLCPADSSRTVGPVTHSHGNCASTIDVRL